MSPDALPASGVIIAALPTTRPSRAAAFARYAGPCAHMKIKIAASAKNPARSK
jgi:hypothetical protein